MRGVGCMKYLKILYLQNNIISKMEDLHHCKQLEYLNIGLNCIAKIEGIHSCEFLNKLDLTVNFIDLDTLEESIDNLKEREHLRELYMMGNPAQADWPGFQRYVIACLPQLQMLDGQEINRTEQILAAQEFPKLQAELRIKAAEVAAKKLAEKPPKELKEPKAKVTDVDGVEVEDIDEESALTTEGGAQYQPVDDDEACPYTPECRVEMYRELAEQKKEKEDREKERQPKKRDYDKEHEDALAKVREREESGNIMQCNEGKIDFSFDELSKPGFVILRVGVPKFMDSSLVDLDVHPHYVSVVIKNKTLRLRWPEEVASESGVAERSKLTGELLVTVPKTDAKSVGKAKREKERMDEDKKEAERIKKEAAQARRKKNLGDELLEAGSKAVKASDIMGIAKNSPNANVGGAPLMKAVSTTREEKDDPEPATTESMASVFESAGLSAPKSCAEQSAKAAAVSSASMDGPPPLF
jgi:protein TilB